MKRFALTCATVAVFGILFTAGEFFRCAFTGHCHATEKTTTHPWIKNK